MNLVLNGINNKNDVKANGPQSKPRVYTAVADQNPQDLNTKLHDPYSETDFQMAYIPSHRRGFFSELWNWFKSIFGLGSTANLKIETISKTDSKISPQVEIYNELLTESKLQELARDYVILFSSNVAGKDPILGRGQILTMAKNLCPDSVAQFPVSLYSIDSFEPDLIATNSFKENSAQQIQENLKLIENALDKAIEKAKAQNKKILLLRKGYGTGYAKMYKYAPKTFAGMADLFQQKFGISYQLADNQKYYLEFLNNIKGPIMLRFPNEAVNENSRAEEINNEPGAIISQFPSVEIYEDQLTFDKMAELSKHYVVILSGNLQGQGGVMGQMSVLRPAKQHYPDSVVELPITTSPVKAFEIESVKHGSYKEGSVDEVSGNLRYIENALNEAIEKARVHNKTILVLRNGYGTGLSRMYKFAPKTFIGMSELFKSKLGVGIKFDPNQSKYIIDFVENFNPEDSNLKITEHANNINDEWARIDNSKSLTA